MKIIQIKNEEIPIIIRNYKYSKHIKFYFRGNTLNISKPKWLSQKKLNEVLKENEKYLYSEYLKILSLENNYIKHWVTGESFFYKGNEFKIVINITDFKRIKVNVDEAKKELQIEFPKHMESLNKMERKAIIDKFVKKMLKKKTEELIAERIAYWSDYTKIKYSSFKVADAISKYGSCIPKTKKMHFSLRLIMLPLEQIDSIIVHELCHIVYANHSDDFYNLVKKYMPDYDQRHKWLKKNNKILAI